MSKGESRNTRRLDKNEVSENEPSDKDEKHTFSLATKQSLKNKPLFKIQSARNTFDYNCELWNNYCLHEEDHVNKQEKTERETLKAGIRNPESGITKPETGIEKDGREIHFSNV